MHFALQTTLIRALLSTALLLPGITELVDAEDLEQLQESYEQTRAQRRAIVDRMEQLESRYREVVQKIDRIKSQSDDGAQNRNKLKKLLRRSRDIADKLETRQEELGKVDARLDELRSNIVDEIDRMVRTIEERLDEVSTSERKKLVRQLNRLQEVRKRHHAPLPEAPDPDEVTATLEMASQVEGANPEQMAAAADELEDTKDQVRERLDAVQEELESLERARTLARRAETFESREQFFDEENRPRRLGRPQGSSESSESDDSSTSSGSEEGTAASPDRSDYNDDSAGETTTDDGSQEAAAPAAGERDGFKSSGDSQASDRTAEAPTASSGGTNTSTGSSSGEPFSSSSDESFVVESDADPSTSVSENFSSREALEQRIQELEREKEQLEGQAEKLEEKARKLRERARELKQFE